MQAQADSQAEVLRKKLEEKRLQRVVAIPKVLSSPTSGKGEGGRGGDGNQVGPRKVWGAPPSGGRLPLLAQQMDATGVITGEGVCVCVCVCSCMCGRVVCVHTYVGM